MLQFYFLSVFLNVLAGYLLFFGSEGGFLELKEEVSVKAETIKLLVGIFSAFTGLFKLLSPIEGDLPLVGDLVPAITGLLAGFALFFEYYRNRSSVEDSKHSETINTILVGNKKIIGAAAFVAGVLHFLFPRVLFL
jgi:hypothetical protein